MTIKRCRICGGEFFKTPLLKYRNMPKAAQYFPDINTLDSEKGVDLTVCQCSACGLVQLANDPVPYYREVIRATAVSKDMTDYRLGQFKTFVDTYDLRGKKAIEVGCGRGEYLSILQEMDLEVYGLEYAEPAVGACFAKGMNVERGFINAKDTKLQNAPFDSFFILNFFEHLPDPNKTLQGLYHNLRDGAVGIIEVPNFDMMLKKKLFSEFIGDHLFYFTKGTLRTTLERNGFEVIQSDEVWFDYIISTVVRKRTPVDLSCFIDCREKLKADLGRYLDQFNKRHVAVWGAGHQALAVIALTGIKDKIAYVIDSAPFKQGKYTPGSHIPIVSPDVLSEKRIDCVIIMAAGYSDEVAKILQTKYNTKIQAAILREFGLEKLN